MKRFVITVLVLTSISLTAQDRKRENNRSEGKSKIQMMTDLTSQEVATLKTKKMTLRFNLSEEQQKAVYSLNLENAELRNTKRNETRKKAELTKTKPNSKEHFQILNDRLDRQIAHKRALQQILNKEQFEKWERSNQREGKRRGQKQKKKNHRSKRSR
jgi:hypothetical protein